MSIVQFIFHLYKTFRNKRDKCCLGIGQGNYFYRVRLATKHIFKQIKLRINHNHKIQLLHFAVMIGTQ